MNTVDLVNKKFGKWTVLNRAGTLNTQAAWNCKCECGKESIVRGASLRRGQSVSCGCERPHFYKEEYAGIYNLLVTNAKKRNIPIDLTFEEFVKFTEQKQCFYCKIPLNWSKRLHKAKHKAYNLDRINNHKGYSANNLVPCCFLCNRTKGSTFSHEQFIKIGKVIQEIYMEPFKK